MRFINKYKNLSKLDRFSFPQFYTRILRFQRPKWKRFQKWALTNKKTFPTFVNPFIIKNSYKQWEKVKHYYKYGIQIKKKAQVLFDTSLTVNSLKKQINKNKKTNKDIFLSSFLRPEFRVDILLWRLNFFSSSFNARQSINEGEVLLNGQKIFSNVFLKKGDVVAFFSKKTFLSTKTLLSRVFTSQKFCTFAEVDYYTKTVVIVKDLKDLTVDDFSLLVQEFFDLKKFRDYL